MEQYQDPDLDRLEKRLRDLLSRNVIVNGPLVINEGIMIDDLPNGAETGKDELARALLKLWRDILDEE